MEFRPEGTASVLVNGRGAFAWTLDAGWGAFEVDAQAVYAWSTHALLRGRVDPASRERADLRRIGSADGVALEHEGAP